MDQKLDTVLNLALETSEEERARTQDLNVGFDGATASWELIAKYHGDLEVLREWGIAPEYLIAGYAVLTVPEALVERVARLEQVEYVEKPKRYYYDEDFGTEPFARTFWEGYGPAENSCFQGTVSGKTRLAGEGVLIAVLDSGIDWKRPEFRRPDGTTRIAALWDQTLREGRKPEGFQIGAEFSAEQINAALQAPTMQEQFLLLPSLDAGGHGTAVAGIAAGYSQETGYLGAAPDAELLIVKLGLASENGFPRTTQIMRAVTWALRKAQMLGRPLVINLSFGNSYGPHDGSSLLERFLDQAAQIGRTVICVGSGNEGNGAGHAGGRITDGPMLTELAVAEYERSLRVQFWQDYSDRYRIFLRALGGQESELTAPVNGGKYTLSLQQTNILAYQGEPTPYTAAKELYLEMLPASGPYLDTGIWTFRVEPVRVVAGQYAFYLSDSASRNGRTGFLKPAPAVTLTVPSAAAGVITVGAYDATYETYADFSGRGYAHPDRTAGIAAAGLTKPDLAAPGVEITAPDIYGSYRAVTGTSFATPIVAGAAAILMQYGIVQGNDPFLYGEKVRAYLRAGARPLRGEEQYPNDRVGYGALCVENSLNIDRR